MKPVDKAQTVLGFRAHGDAKPQLLARLGEFCSYCECSGAAQQLHVEHIYPQTETAHPGRSKNWRNFLIACPTCNTYKARHLGNGRQQGMLRRFIWPHIDNTVRCFDYLADGRVEITASLHPDVQALAESTRDMVGLMISPGATADYIGTGIAYDGIQKRSAAWGIAQRARVAYEENPSQNQLASLLDNATQTGHFSIWMQVFHDRPAVRRDLIQVFRAAPTCFNANTDPVPRGRV
jgi:uncharacterized protein (TIGR02646 family)